jgi:hypothetical protein
MPLERDDTNCDAQYFIGKVQIVCEGDEFFGSRENAVRLTHVWGGGAFIYCDAHKFAPPLDTINV